MSNKTAKMAGVISIVAAGPALAAAPPAAQAAPVAASYAELLQPIPNAVERLKMDDARRAERPAVLINVADHHHHHHHSKRWYRQHGYVWSGAAWILKPAHHHHNHDHH